MSYPKSGGWGTQSNRPEPETGRRGNPIVLAEEFTTKKSYPVSATCSGSFPADEVQPAHPQTTHNDLGCRARPDCRMFHTSRPRSTRWIPERHPGGPRDRTRRFRSHARPCPRSEERRVGKEC